MSWTNTNKNSASWGNSSKTLFQEFLLKEDGGYLLLETGDKIILEQSIPSIPTWTNASKN